MILVLFLSFFWNCIKHISNEGQNLVQHTLEKRPFLDDAVVACEKDREVFVEDSKSESSPLTLVLHRGLLPISYLAWASSKDIYFFYNDSLCSACSAALCKSEETWHSWGALKYSDWFWHILNIGAPPQKDGTYHPQCKL